MSDTMSEAEYDAALARITYTKEQLLAMTPAQRTTALIIRDKVSSKECPSCLTPWEENPSGRITMSPDTLCGHTACRKCYFTYLETSDKTYGSCMICREPSS